MKTNINKLMQHLQPNTTLQGGKYRIERVLGQGGFGITYLANDDSQDRKVAIKELFINGVNERLQSNKVIVSNSNNEMLFTGQINKFQKEAKRIMQLHDEHIVPVYELFNENSTVYYVMEYIEGETLSEIMEKQGQPFSIDEVDDIFKQIIDTLSVIHSHDILHLDIKPGNIMIDKSGGIKLIDFGASKLLTSEETALTGFYFTKGYAPPEQTGMLFNQFGPWTDFYAVGATMYNLLTKENPQSFDIENFSDEGISDEFIKVLLKLICWMMQPNKRHRPQMAMHIREKYSIEMIKAELLYVISDVLGHKISYNYEDDLDVVSELHATPEQCHRIKTKINEIFKVDVNKASMTIYSLLKPIFISYDLYSPSEEDNEQTRIENIQTRISINGHDAADLGLSVLWATMDIGASNESGYGNCFLWGDPDGENTKKVQSSFFARWFKGGPTSNMICGNIKYDTATNMWGRRWRMPTRKEFEELATKCEWELIDNNHARLYGPNGNSIIIDSRYHWTGESPFGNMVMFEWHNENGETTCSFPSTQTLDKDYTDLFFPIRPVAEK